MLTIVAIIEITTITLVGSIIIIIVNRVLIMVSQEWEVEEMSI